jgi:hypothetical protein
MCDHESKRGCAIGKGTGEDRFVRKYIHKIDIKKRERGTRKRPWWQTDEYQLDPMLAFMSSDLNSIFAFNCHTCVATLSQHYIVENIFCGFR